MVNFAVAILALLSALLVPEIQANYRNMLCREVDSISDQDVSEQGATGGRKKPGKLSFSAMEDFIESMIDEKIEEKFGKIKALLARHNSTRKEEESDQKDKELCKSRHGIIYLNRCYWLKMTTSRTVTFQKAFQLCQQDRGCLGDVINVNHYHKLLQMVKDRGMLGPTFYWTGMSVNLETKELKLANSSLGDSDLWYPNYPLDSPDLRTGIMVWFERNSSRAVWNEEATTYAQGALCHD